MRRPGAETNVGGSPEITIGFKVAPTELNADGDDEIKHLQLIGDQSEMAALQYLDSLLNSHPELSDWYNKLADLYQRKLWHQLTLKLEQFVALTVFQFGG